jgi:glycosyltransferase involved in cell wall biosynthesis
MADRAVTGATPDPGRSLSIAMLGDANSIHVRRWAAYFAGRGHRVTLLVPGDQEPEPGLAEGVTVARFAPTSSGRIGQLGLIASGRAVSRAVGRIRPDILQVHYLTVNGFRGWMSGFHPYAVAVWGNDVLVDPKKSTRARLLARLSLRAADLVTGLSQHLVDAAIASGARRERTRMIHFGVDTDLFSPGPDPVGLRKSLRLEGRRILFSPRIIDTLYRHETVIDALAALPEDVTLVMNRYRANPQVLASLQRRIDEEGLGARVAILEETPYSERPAFYRLADVVVSVPETDGGPLTLVEALAVGRPIVCSDLPPVREWLEELDPTCLVPVGDSAATAAAIETVLARSTEERASFAERGRAAVLERADQARTMAEVERLYRQLAAGGPGGRSR